MTINVRDPNIRTFGYFDSAGRVQKILFSDNQYFCWIEPVPSRHSDCVEVHVIDFEAPAGTKRRIFADIVLNFLDNYKFNIEV